MIDVSLLVLIISLIVALGGLVALLLQSHRGESHQHTEELHLLPGHRDHHRRTRFISDLHKSQTSRISTFSATKDAPAAWLELLESVKRECGMALNPVERLRLQGPKDDATSRLDRSFNQDVLIDRVLVARERLTR